MTTADVLSTGLLGVLPQPGSYVSIVKLVIHVLLILPWFWLAIWSSRDVEYVRTNGPLWRSVVLGAGLLGLILWWLIPIFVVGLLAYLLFLGGAVGTYVYHRNSLVGPAAKVLTVQHIKGLLAGVKGKERKAIPELVRFLDSEKRAVPIPADDPDQLEQFRLAQELVYDAIWRRASDVEVLTSSEQAKVAYRVDGVLTARPAMERDNADRVIEFVKKIGGLDLEDHRRPQQGEFTATVNDPVTGQSQSQEVEVRTAGSTTGQRMTLRMMTQEKQFRVDDLGLREEQAKLFHEVLNKPHGLVIFSGPPGSGVTTTLYAALRSHDAFTQNIQTFEKQPKFDLEVITQHVFDPSKGISFARSLQTVLHKDPDILMVAELPDKESAYHVARAMSLNKKVYIGIPANDCFEALDRWMRLNDDPKAATTNLLAVVNQRLVRKLCPVCKVPYKPDAELLRRANIAPDKAKQFYRPRTEPRVDKHGNPIICPNCQGSGYYGRTAIFELLMVTTEIINLLRKGAAMDEVRAASRKRAMLYLQEEALHRVIDGTTSVQEVLRATKSESRKAGAR